MYPAVADAFPKAIGPIEGVLRWPYLDRLGFVTTAMGYKVDDENGQVPQAMYDLPWHYVMPTGAPETSDIIASQPLATRAQVTDGWQRVKNSGLAGLGGGNPRFGSLTNLRLDDTGIEQSTTNWIKNAEPILRQSFPRWDTMQADAQMAILNMAWGMGPAFVPAKHFYKFAAAINALVPDYDTAAAESTMQPTSDKAISDHNALSQVLLGNAKRWQSTNLPPFLLWWKPPGTPGANQPPGPSGGPGGGGVASIYRESFLSRVGGVVGKLTIGLIVFGFGWVGVSAYRAHKRGEPWLAPVRRLGSRVNRAEHAAEVKVENLLQGKA